MKAQTLSKQWRSALAQVWVGGALIALGTQASADAGQVDQKYFEISSVQISSEDLDASGAVINNLGTEEYTLKEWDQRQVTLQQNRTALLRKFGLLNQQSSSDFSLAQIINFGAKLWKLVEANKPVVAVNTTSANALPAGVEGNWLALENWQEPRARRHAVTYKNVYGIEVVNFDYRITYTAGGVHDGKGLYLSNVAVNPQNLSVAWGYNVEANAKVVNVLNTGTKNNPRAGMEVLVEWKIKTILKDMRSSTSFFVKGDGGFLDLNHGL